MPLVPKFAEADVATLTFPERYRANLRLIYEDNGCHRCTAFPKLLRKAFFESVNLFARKVIEEWRKQGIGVQYLAIPFLPPSDWLYYVEADVRTVIGRPVEFP